MSDSEDAHDLCPFDEPDSAVYVTESDVHLNVLYSPTLRRYSLVHSSDVASLVQSSSKSDPEAYSRLSRFHPAHPTNLLWNLL